MPTVRLSFIVEFVLVVLMEMNTVLNREFRLILLLRIDSLISIEFACDKLILSYIIPPEIEEVEFDTASDPVDTPMVEKSKLDEDTQDKTTVLQPHSSEVGFINHMLILKLSKAQVDQGSQIKMIQVKEMMQDNDLKNSKSKDKGSKSRSQSMDEQSHYKQDKTITRQSINVKRHIFNVIGGTEEFEERDLNIGGDC
ncbi:hypothetical protein Tco_0643373 [Tanacetum coccineum]